MSEDIGWRVRAIRGATTVDSNTVPAIEATVSELLDALWAHNPQVLADLDNIVNVIFSATPDLNALFPAQVARSRPGWDQVPLLDVQQMSVPGSLPRCIRVLIQVNTPCPRQALNHLYLRAAQGLRPDLSPPLIRR